MAGELEILTTCGISVVEKNGEILLVEQLAYLNRSYEWELLHNIYMAIVCKIKLGRDNWGSR